MRLTVAERIVLLGILPREGNYLTLKIVRKLRESLSFTEEEHQKYRLRQEEGRILWDVAVEQEAEVPIGEKASDIVVEALKRLDKEGKLTDQDFTLYEKFIGE